MLTLYSVFCLQASQNLDKKDEFRKYLERTKVINVLTQCLTDLFEMDDRPNDPLAYLIAKLGEQKTAPNAAWDRSGASAKPAGVADIIPSEQVNDPSNQS
jgi:hypothetical protein